MKKLLVSVSVAIAAAGLIGTAAPAQAAEHVTPRNVSTASYHAAKESVAQQNARRMAASYLKTMPFSRTGLIDQLEYEGFTTKLATYGVDKQHANWNYQAARMAKSYLRTMPFSRQGLIDQLEYEGFTTAQATYGVKKAGL
ncbi:Ltp family lipoprotein [Actinoplanes sp. LDG1-06]|uniref:Ltp family lipoprotein n=1 Tax=Paractinoplanes ovalisporus TaxID=2810368 RepID=A0ABS2A8N7_9ACTN|nr:Ltp family lipoprotein [Actinoplanes ovalisporus]MBM2616197.1 Ltp family lipoprotein [Actinoplanes ovalisporus]